MKYYFRIILFTSLVFQYACGSCPSREVTQEVSDFVSYMVTVSDQINPPFSKEVESSGSNQLSAFIVNESYLNPNKPAPSDLISFQFFFRSNALPGGESIFDQMEGEVFSYQNVPYDGQDIIYIEFAPNTPDYVPTSYSGTVSITDPNHVLFDLTFTNGSQSRRVESVFFFQTATFDSPIGECEP